METGAEIIKPMKSSKNIPHSTYYATRNDCTPVLQFDELKIIIASSDTAEIHFDHHPEFHAQIDRENLKRILAFMDSIKTKKK